MLTGSPLSATYPTIPVPHGIRISSFFSISIRVDLEQTSKSLETRHLPLGCCPGGRGVHPPPFSPCTKKREPRSAWRSMDTFWRILWHKERTSSSLQISFTWKKNTILTILSRSTTHLIYFFYYYARHAKNYHILHNL